MNKPTRRVSLEDFFANEKAKWGPHSTYDDDNSTLLRVFPLSLNDRVTSLEMEIEQAAVLSEIQEAHARDLEEENERLRTNNEEVTRKLKELEVQHRDLKNVHLWLKKQSKNMKDRVINQVINEIQHSKDVREAPDSNNLCSAMAQKSRSTCSIRDDLKNENVVLTISAIE
eukprot:CAMPEP_0198299098 /NCGR_PEP_ID=MMETSP1449-20131203/43402_1 /TAXON_ID=420275 /ORGANISM="Attheya septentrionalis, Strain CCMP2084" /LENGTH=170 /DNA_ID=CAMNT_0044000545 /DNA_START=162 /DNA_END=674 /DNA_ORIENTATION=-